MMEQQQNGNDKGSREKREKLNDDVENQWQTKR